MGGQKARSLKRQLMGSGGSFYVSLLRHSTNELPIPVELVMTSRGDRDPVRGAAPIAGLNDLLLRHHSNTSVTRALRLRSYAGFETGRAGWPTGRRYGRDSH